MTPTARVRTSMTVGSASLEWTTDRLGGCMPQPTDRANGSSAGVLVAWLLVVAAVAVAAMEWFLVTLGNPAPLWDLEVYRGAISLWLDGGSLYEYRLDHPAREGGFPFTYPPFAALVLVPLAWVPTAVADNMWTLLGFALTTAMAAVVVWRAPRSSSTWLGTRPTRALLVAWTAGGTVVLMLSLPGVHNVVLGQVSFLIATMMLVDVGGLVRGRLHGALVGLAAAIKLTPLMAIPYFLVTRQWRSAAVASGVFAGATLLALAVIPSGSLEYWTDKLFVTSRVGDPATIQNKSVLGLLARLDLAETAQTVAWVLLLAVVVGAGLWQARRQYLAGEQVGAALIVGCASVAASPVSWPHHQVWIVLVAIWLLLMRRPLFMALGAVLVVVNFVASPLMGQEVVPHGEDVSLLLRLGREVPTVSFVLVCLLGLPLRHLRAPTPGRGSMSPPEPARAA